MVDPKFSIIFAETLKQNNMNTAKFVETITVTDPDSGLPVDLSVYKHNQSGGMLAIDSSYLDQCFDDDNYPVIPDIMNVNRFGKTKETLMLEGD